MHCDCPPFSDRVEDFLCTNQACNLKGTVELMLFVIEVRHAVKAKAGTADGRVTL